MIGWPSGLGRCLPRSRPAPRPRRGRPLAGGPQGRRRTVRADPHPDQPGLGRIQMVPRRVPAGQADEQADPRRRRRKRRRLPICRSSSPPSGNWSISAPPMPAGPSPCRRRASQPETDGHVLRHRPRAAHGRPREGGPRRHHLQLAARHPIPTARPIAACCRSTPTTPASSTAATARSSSPSMRCAVCRPAPPRAS